ncbi:MAG: hypothetical protein GY820_26585 [Gammaproteobacteria bacterium]|nr:hypothetical protein [Gammaproteobacteria bacterium]
MSTSKIIFGATLVLSTSLAAQEKLEMEGTLITGNKELPKVLYIVPWKPAPKIDITTPPIVSILDQPLQTIERNTFRRQVKYHQVTFPTPAAQ